MDHAKPAVPAGIFPPGAGPVPGSVHEAFVAQRLDEVGRFGKETLAEHVRRHARDRGDRTAYVSPELRLTWRELDELSDRVAATLVAVGFERGERVAIWFPDGPVVHALYLALEKAGLIAVGIAPRAADQEITHLVTLSGAAGLLTSGMGDKKVANLRSAGAPVRHHVTIEANQPAEIRVDGAPGPHLTLAERDSVLGGRALGLAEVFVINATSGSTGMPKCVMHNQNRWLYFHSQVLRTADLGADDVILSLIPSPYGFGIWSAHVTPILLGATTVLLPRFDAAEAIRLIDREQATVLAAVTTQFLMLLNSPEITGADLSSLKCLYTGGEPIPYQRAAEFEQRTGSAVLNFYGSNETGMLSYTTTHDGGQQRWTTGGKPVPDMDVRLFDEHFAEVSGVPGQAACRGPAASLGYYADPDANATLFSPGGWMLTGDLCAIDESGYLRVVGRTADFIIRGGKNISAAAVEQQVSTHSAVALAAAIGVPDPVFGERVCVVVELQPDATLDLSGLTEHLDAQGVSKEVWPERLEIVPRLPRSTGGKVAKTTLRQQFGNAASR